MTSREFQRRLKRRLGRTDLATPATVLEPLEAYYRLLQRWNEKINLTALPLDCAPEGTLDRLLVEPLLAARHLPRGEFSLMDIGSGGGSPAIPMKIATSSAHLTMVEAKTRKAVFLRECVRGLSLADATVETARFEHLLARPDLHEAIDVLTVRAVRVEIRVLMNLQAFVKVGGTILLFRGATGQDPTRNLPPPLEWRGTFPLVDGSASRLVRIEKKPLRPTH